MSWELKVVRRLERRTRKVERVSENEWSREYVGSGVDSVEERR